MKNLLLNESYLEEILEQVFSVESGDSEIDSLAYLLTNSIYDLSDDKELEIRAELEQKKLDEDCSSLENIPALQKEAETYFSNPSRYYIPKESERSPFVTCYVQYMANVYFSKNGNAVECWKSMGIKYEVTVNELLCPDTLISKACDSDISWNNQLRIVVYGDPLKELVGTKFYSKGEKRELVELIEGDSSILLAIPCYESVSSKEESLYDFVEKKLNDAVLCGEDPGLNRMSYAHYELTKQRLEELAIEQKEVAKLESLTKREKLRTNKVDSFNDKFRPYKEIIAQINSGELKVDDLRHIELIDLKRIVYMAEKQGERITNAKIYFLIKSMISKASVDEIIQDPSSKEAFSIIEQINSGEITCCEGLAINLVEAIMKILWSKSGVRINSEYKEVYFQLKERYNTIKPSIKIAA